MKFFKVLTVGVASALLLGACSSSQNESVESKTVDLYGHTISYDEALANRVPDEWKKGITVPIQVLRPNAFIDESGGVVGLQPDLMTAMAIKMGIPVTMEPTSFDAQVPGI